MALTRTKNEVVLLIPPEASSFAEELINENGYIITSNNGSLNTVNCTYCKTGKLVLRKNQLNGNQFLGCSHYPACNRTYNNIDILFDNIVCPHCNSGFMTKRRGKFGNFLGCTNYPDCRKTIDLK